MDQQFFALVITTPNKITRTVGPVSNKRSAAVEAYKVLTRDYPGPQVPGPEATALLLPLVDAELGAEAHHAATGYRFRIALHSN